MAKDKDADSADSQVIMRVPESVKRRIAKHIERMRAATPGTRPSMTEACVNLVLRGLDSAEAN
jgi:hypothetical protein